MFLVREPGLKTHEIVGRPQKVFLPELNHGVGPLALDIRFKPHGLHAGKPRGIFPALCHEINRKAGLKKFPVFKLFGGNFLGRSEGLDEFDPIKVDRISPDDAVAIREGGTTATLKGIQFNSFGAFFSRAYRENDYLWGRLHGADRLIDIVVSTLPEGVGPAIAAGCTMVVKPAANLTRGRRGYVQPGLKVRRRAAEAPFATTAMPSAASHRGHRRSASDNVHAEAFARP